MSKLTTIRESKDILQRSAFDPKLVPRYLFRISKNCIRYQLECSRIQNELMVLLGVLVL